MSEWKTIDTLPEGQHVLLWWAYGERGNGGAETAMVFKKDHGSWSYWTHGGPNSGHDWDSDEHPTHWMPLPEPPK